MIGHSYTADNLASEFLRIMKASEPASQEIEKQASAVEEAPGAGSTEVTSTKEVDAADFLVSDASDSSFDESNYELENKIKDLSNLDYEKKGSVISDERAHSLLNGLGKIAKRLNDKGERFAADMVHATAASIHKDFIREADILNRSVYLIVKKINNQNS